MWPGKRDVGMKWFITGFCVHYLGLSGKEGGRERREKGGREAERVREGEGGRGEREEEKEGGGEEGKRKRGN